MANATTAGPWEVTAAQVHAWLASLTVSPDTRRSYEAAVRAFYEWAISDGRTDHNPAPTRTTRPGPAPRTTSPAWTAWLEAWQAHLRAAGASEETVHLRVRHLKHVARSLRLDPADVTTDALVAWMAGSEMSAETRRAYRSSLRACYSWAFATSRTSNDPAASLPRVRPAHPSPHPASARAYEGALAGADDRETLMLRLAAELGLRRGEVARVHSRDLLEDDDGWTLLVRGKGQRDRVIPLPDGLAATLRALPAGYAFPGGDNGHLSPAYIGKIVSRLLPSGVTMHALRHRFATRAYGLDRDVFTVQQLLGHASPATTRRYVQVPRATMRSTVNALA
ncbi:tyrosine-type recombinase/integrase [Flavimobilis sp. GY10621]|uniref:Tyrosine-type recombinase/integrase n=2 Tax=Flavimobilis rhizosphaerae TaxID=2775421 RepID=A0ABR9DTR6_9MICO|nr:tyrosine-type recombinase/integrase [Flavimobilis rhizosphaerae]